MKRIYLHFLHIEEQTSFICHSLEYGFHILKLDHALGNHIHNLCSGICFSFDFFKIALQLSIHVDTSFRKLPNFRTTQVCCCLNLSIGKDKPIHTHS